jgi:membrane-associated phospholipid phosphatase
MSRSVYAACVFAGLLCAAVPVQSAAAATNSRIGTAGTYVAIALPVVAGGIAVWKDDWTGAKQLTAATVLTVGTVYVLKHFIKERRPDYSDYKSFPSDTSALASAPAAFLWQRYGWEYGLPAFAASTFVSYSRVHAKKHHFWDVLASTAISIGYNEMITTRFHPRNTFYSSLDAGRDGVYASVHYTW